jgi:hypothetical protein
MNVVEDVVREHAQRLERAAVDQAPEHVNRDEAAKYVYLARNMGESLRFLWEKLRARLDDGLEVGKARHATAALSLGVESWHRMHLQLQEWGKVFAGKGSPLGELAALDSQSPELLEIKAAVAKLLDFVNSPRQPIDPAVLEQAKGDYDPGKFQNTKDAIARRKARPAR